MNQYYDVEAISSDVEGLKKVSDLQGVKVYCIEMTRRITPLLDIISLWKLYQYFKKEKPFIVHTHTPKAGALGMIAAKLAGVPHRLHTVAGMPLLETKGAKRKLLNLVEKITYSCATFIYPNSNGLKKIIIQENFCLPNKLKVLENGSSNGINTSYFNPELYTEEEKQIFRMTLGFTKEDFIFIFVGRLVGDKGVNELVGAFKNLEKRNELGSKFKLILAGSFETNLDLLKLQTLQEIDSNENILYVGFQNEIRKFFAISDCLVLPSYREGFPNVVLQAGSMGLPSIVTNINGNNEIITNGENGMIIPAKDETSLYQAMQNLFTDVSLRTYMCQNARKMIVNRFEQTKIWEAILAEYRSLEDLPSLTKIKKKIIRTATISTSLNYLLKGQLAFLQNNYEVVAISSKDEFFDIVGERENVKMIPVPITRNISILKDLKSMWDLYLIFRKEKPLIVHSITPKAGLLSMVAAYFARVPIRIHTFTGLIFPTKLGLLRQILILMDKILCRLATVVYPEGLGVMNDLKKYEITKKPLKILANGNVNGIDLEYFNVNLFSKEYLNSLRNSLGITPDDFIFIFIGRLVGDKGINELVSAFNLFCNTINQNSKLLLVGAFETKHDPLLSTTLEQINVNKNILSIGFQNDVRPYFAISQCLVFPSYREGFPNVVLQAGAMGLPSIVTNISGCNEIIINDVNGCIIPLKDTIAIYEAMKKIMEDSSFRTHLIQNARPMIESRYEQAVLWEAILKEYKRLECNV
jgi:glycosyltransferase involved in cell wall biosynthesis